MIPYWTLLTFSILFFIASSKFDVGLRRLLWCFFALIFVLVIGLRYEVGGDWDAYLVHFSRMENASLLSVVLGSDPGYYFVNWAVSVLGGGVVWVNLVCATIFVVGLFRFAARQPLPWLALVVAIPYLVIVVAMGYTRQAAALGFLMGGLVSLQDKHIKTFVLWVVLGALFHKSAVLMLPVAALASSVNRFWSFFWIGVVSLCAAYLLVLDSAEELWHNYVVADYQSQGGLIRVLMNSAPAVLFLVFRARIYLATESERRLWTWIALFSLACIPLVALSSTATDRMALYLIPIQIYVFSRIHTAASGSYFRALLVVVVIIYYTFVQLVWLNFANHAHDWLPYQMYPFAS